MILFKAKDGGPESTVTGYWLCEFKKLFSIVLLKFEGASREAYHEHAFDAASIVLTGGLIERFFGHPDWVHKVHLPSIKPVITRRNTFHKVSSIGDTTWVLSFRGPWKKTWREYIPSIGAVITLTNGREQV